MIKNSSGTYSQIPKDRILSGMRCESFHYILFSTASSTIFEKNIGICWLLPGPCILRLQYQMSYSMEVFRMILAGEYPLPFFVGTCTSTVLQPCLIKYLVRANILCPSNWSKICAIPYFLSNSIRELKSALYRLVCLILSIIGLPIYGNFSK